MCGEVADPPGMFLSTTISINPFRNIPILGNWIIDNTHTLYAFFMSDPQSKITPSNKTDILSEVSDIDDILARLLNYINSVATSFLTLMSSTAQQYIERFSDIIVKLKIMVGQIRDSIEYFEILDNIKDIWDEIKIAENLFLEFRDNTEFVVNKAKYNFVSFVMNETITIKQKLDTGITSLRNQVMDAMKDFSGFGLKYKTRLVLFGLILPLMDIEVVYSVDSMMKCSRFEKVAELMNGKPAVRILGRTSTGQKLGRFIVLDKGAGVGGAFGSDKYDVIVQYNAYINMIGIKITSDLFISKNGLYFYIEGNIWNTFLAQIEVSAELGQNWGQLKFVLSGRFVAKGKKKRQIQTNSDSFQSSYIDALKGCVRRTASWAKRTLDNGKNALSKAQSGLTKAQNWLDYKKIILRSANRHFDNTVTKLDRAKDKLEAAKGPFQKAIQKLNAAQRKVDNICKIKTCKPICVPGVKLTMCKRGWFRYPCLRKTSCMFKITDWFCKAANAVCYGVRLVAYGALEAAKLFVRIPMVALDIAKATVSVAQFAVDKSRVVLVVAEGFLELAKLGLEVTKGVLETAKVGLEAIKLIIGAAAKVLEMVIQYGIQSLIDVRNCGFRAELSTANLAVFDVSCDINVLRLGWSKVKIRVNFKNIIQSLWNAATAVIKEFKEKIGFGRKKRELSYNISSSMHKIFREIRESDPQSYNDTSTVIEETIDAINKTLGFESDTSSEFENRVLVFEYKCNVFKRSKLFLQTAFDVVFELINETKHSLDSMINGTQYTNTSTEDLQNNLNLSSAGVDIDFIMNTYNVTMEDLELSVQETKDSFVNDPEIQEHANLTSELYGDDLNSFDTDQLIASWILAMENTTKEFYNDTECAGFNDCLFQAITSLYDIHQAETYPNITDVQEYIQEIEENSMYIVLGNSINISSIYTSTITILSSLANMDTIIPFCDFAPSFITQPKNTTFTNGSSVNLDCTGEGSLPLEYRWYKDGEIMYGLESPTLRLSTVSIDDEGIYSCTVENVVASLSSREAHVSMVEIDDGMYFKINIIALLYGVCEY